MIFPTIRAAPRKANRASHGNYVGARDALDPSKGDARLAFLLRNVYPLQPEIGGGVVGRPGCTIMDDALAVEIQREYQFTKLDGTEHTVIIAGGELYTYDWVTDTRTKVVTTANLTTAAITLKTTGLVYCVTVADTMMVSDGVHIPFTWDGTAGAGGLTSLTNCPVLYGPPTIHYAKVVGIKNTERSTIVWSEENQPNVGYEAGGYNNAWTLGQTEQEGLYAVKGTNEALYYFRARSIGAIWGPVSASWQTTGTHDAVSEKVGTTSPGSVVLYQDSLYFLDADSRPQRVIIGGNVVDNPGIWELCAETLQVNDLLTSALEVSEATYNPLLDIVTFGVRTQEGTALDRLLNFDPPTGRFVGYFDGFEFQTLGLVRDSVTGATILAHGDADGGAYKHGTPSAGPWSDALASGTEAISHVIESATLGYDPTITTLWSRVDVLLRLDASITALTLGLVTPSGDNTTVLSTWTGVSLDLWDEALWDDGEWADLDTNEFKLPIGIAELGRWLRVRLSHAVLGEQFGLIGITATGTIQGADVTAA